MTTPTLHLGLNRQPDYTGALAAQQREEDARAAAWVEWEVRAYLLAAGGALSARASLAEMRQRSPQPRTDTDTDTDTRTTP